MIGHSRCQHVEAVKDLLRRRCGGLVWGLSCRRRAVGEALMTNQQILARERLCTSLAAKRFLFGI